MIAPSGCHWCGVVERSHAQRWHRVSPMKYGGTFEKYVPPTDAQIKKRMLEGRAEREARA